MRQGAMKMKVFLIVVCMMVCAFNPFANFAQESVKPVSVKEVYVQIGTPYYWNNTVTVKDYRRVFSQSSFLKEDLTGYQQSNGSYSYGGSKFAVQMGLKFRNKEKTGFRNSTLRVGFVGTSGVSFGTRLSKYGTFRYDTLISQKTGSQYFVDSQSYSSYSMNYQSNHLLLDAALIYRSNTSKRWSLFGGFGIAAGTSVSASDTVRKQQYSNVANGYETTLGGSSNNSQEEVFKGPKSMLVSAYIPLGVDFKLSRKNTFFSKIHLFYEMQPSLVYAKVDGFGSFSNLQILNALGTRITW